MQTENPISGRQVELQDSEQCPSAVSCGETGSKFAGMTDDLAQSRLPKRGVGAVQSGRVGLAHGTKRTSRSGLAPEPSQPDHQGDCYRPQPVHGAGNQRRNCLSQSMRICLLTESRKNKQRHGNCYHSNSQHRTGADKIHLRTELTLHLYRPNGNATLPVSLRHDLQLGYVSTTRSRA